MLEHRLRQQLLHTRVLCGIVRLTEVACRTYNRELSGCKLTPLGHGGGSGLFENSAAVEMAVVVEMVVDRSMDGGEFLQGLDVSKPRHCPFPPSEGLM